MKLNKTRKVLNVLSKAMAVVGLVVIISSVAFSVPIATAQTYSTTAPQWNTGCVTQPSNCNSSEQNWFQVSNATQGTPWADTISGVNPGDTINFKVYMHNNTCPANDATGNTSDNCPATDATHAYVHVTLPQSGGTVTATIGSDQSGSNISRSLTLPLPNGQTITYKMGSTRIIHNQFDTNTFWPIPNDPVTENGADNVTSGNLDQGQIDGCYSWSRFITFQAVVSNVTTTSVTTPSAPTTTTTTTTTVTSAKTLPKTGPEDGLQLLLLGMVPAGVLLRKFRI